LIRFEDNQIRLKNNLNHGETRKTLSELINCKSSMSPEMAVRIGKATKTSPDSWLYMQSQLDLWYAGQKPTEVEEFGNVALA